MDEIWKDIEGFEGRYQISNEGNVKSLIYNKILKHTKNPGGYATVRLFHGDKGQKYQFKDYQVHRLVGKYFLSNPDNLPMINHVDENKMNPKVENLEWISAKGNSNHGNRNNTISDKVGRPICQYTLSGQLIRIWKNSARVSEIIAKKLDADPKAVSSSIRRVVTGQGVLAYGYMWRTYNGKIIKCIKKAEHRYKNVKLYEYYKGKTQLVKISKRDIREDDLYVENDYSDKTTIELLEQVISNIKVEQTYMNIMIEIKQRIELHEGKDR